MEISAVQCLLLFIYIKKINARSIIDLGRRSRMANRNPQYTHTHMWFYERKCTRIYICMNFVVFDRRENKGLFLSLDRMKLVQITVKIPVILHGVVYGTQMNRFLSSSECYSKQST